MKTRDLTRGERMFVDRKRRRMSQKDVAAELGVGLNKYRAWELDAEEVDQPSPAIGTLQPHEACLVLRRREGLGVTELAEELGVCRWWLHLMESGQAPIEALREYWGV